VEATVRNAVEYVKKANNVLQTNNNPESPVALANTSEEKTNKSAETPRSTLNKTEADNQFNKNSTESNIAEAKTNLTDETKAQDEKQHKPTIEEAIEIAKNRDDDDEKEDLNRWSVAPNAAPVFFNTMGKGSSIDPQFNNNSKS